MWIMATECEMELDLTGVETGPQLILADRDVDGDLADELFGAAIEELAREDRQREWDREHGEIDLGA